MPDAPADSDLLRRYADSRDEPAFRELVHRHLPFVYSTALRRCSGNTHLAEEVVQTVFTDLARKASRLSHHTSLAGWLHTSTRYAASATFRSAHRRLLRETEALAMQENAPSLDLTSAWSHLRPVIDAALDQLSAHDRELILLRYFENQPFATLSKTHQLSEDAARKRTERALEKLRTILSRRGVTSTSAALGLVLTSQAGAAVTAPAGLAVTISSTAIAGAAAGATASLSIFLMAQSKLATATLIALASAATVCTAILATNISDQQTALTHLSAQTSAAHAPSDLARQLTATERSLAEAHKTSATQKQKIAALPPRPPLTKPGDNVIWSAKLDIYLAADPDYSRLRRQRLREEVIKSYGDLFAELKLPPDKLEALKEHLVDERVEAELARAQAVASGASAASAETKATLRVVADAALRSLFGDQVRDAIRRVEAVGHLHQDLRADFGESGQPLSRSQERQLASALYDHIKAPATRRSPPEPLDTGVLPSDLSAAETQVIAHMRAQLTPQQCDLLADHFKFERARTAFEQRVAHEAP